MIVLSPATHPQGSDAWLQARAGACTASRFSDAVSRVGGLTEQQAKYVEVLQATKSIAKATEAAGYKKQPSASAILRAMAGERVDTPSDAATRYAWTIAMETIARVPLDDTFVTYAMRRGRELEPQARGVYEVRTKRWVDEVSLILTDDSRYGYSADGFVDDDGMVEIKCPLACDKLGRVWETPGEAHLEYIDQINGGLWITGRLWCDLVVYCPWLEPVGKDLFVKRIYRDDDAIETLESGLVEFTGLVDQYLTVLRTPTTMAGNPRDKSAPAPVAQPQPTTDPAAHRAISADTTLLPSSIF